MIASHQRPDVWVIQTARCNDRGGLEVEGLRHGRPFEAGIAHHEPVCKRFDFSGCSFGPGARDRLELLRTTNGEVS
jgi:hypothetical protein